MLGPELVEIVDKAEIRAFLESQGRALHIYEIGDLDDFFFPFTRWMALRDSDGQLLHMALLYNSPDLPVLLMFGNDVVRGKILLSLLSSTLPSRIYSHLTPGLLESLTAKYSVEPHGLYVKMAIQDNSLALNTCSQFEGSAERLSVGDLQKLLEFYSVSYQGNWFDSRMLETGQTFGVWSADRGYLLAVAGIHVYSVACQVAALGNIATHPAWRRRGLARQVTAALVCSLLRAGVRTVGLNVRADNACAIACYSSLGFVTVASYEEAMLTETSVRGLTAKEDPLAS